MSNFIPCVFYLPQKLKHEHNSALSAVFEISEKYLKKIYCRQDIVVYYFYIHSYNRCYQLRFLDHLHLIYLLIYWYKFKSIIFPFGFVLSYLFHFCFFASFELIEHFFIIPFCLIDWLRSSLFCNFLDSFRIKAYVFNSSLSTF